VAAPQGLVCLMMATAGLGNPDQLPAGVEIDEVVVAELFALELAWRWRCRGRCRRRRGRRAGGGFRRSAGIWRAGQIDAEGLGRASLSKTAGFGWGFGDAFEGVGDGGVVGGGGGEGLFGQTPAGGAAEAAAVGLQLFGEGG
jgi:hypothetical protein